jgi:hypothetical protein
MAQPLANRLGFRFGLRTLLVIVTACALFCVHNMHWIHQRREFLAEQRAHDGELDVSKIAARQNGQLIDFRTYARDDERFRPKNSPIFLWLFGEEAYQSVTITHCVAPSRPPDPARLTRHLEDEVVIFVGEWDETRFPQQRSFVRRNCFPRPRFTSACMGPSRNRRDST